ncbi:glycosyltransferase family 4 protein [Winogradskyella sp. A2]|uniref:glycosyltransferase family 4 protein n=1 Tax=Winogradskyella sp. A2 TaxID=3366944 RepID=UPI00398C6412
MKKIFYIESIDIHNLYGTGGGPMLRYSSKVSNDFVYVTFTSKKRELLNLNSIQYDNQTYNYIPIAYTIKSSFLNRIIPLNIYFIIMLAWRFNRVNKIVETKNVITKTYSVLWYFAFFKKHFSLCYVYPGLENPMEIGRFSFFTKYLKSIFEFVNDKALRKAQAVFVSGSRNKINKKNIQLEKKNINTKIIQIPQVVDSKVFYKKNIVNFKSLLPIRKKYVFSFLGRLSNVKGIDFIIDAFEKFNLKVPDSLLLIIGEGEESERINKLILKKKLNKSILLLGKIKPPALINYINLSTAGLFASYAEGFSNAMLEYLACGTPIISTNVGGVDELIIEGETGYIITERCLDQFISAMHKSLHVNMSENCLKHVRNNFELMKQWEIIEYHWEPLKLKRC